METYITITVVGLRLKQYIDLHLHELDINQVNQVNTGMLGNFNTVKYSIVLPSLQLVDFRKKFVDLMHSNHPDPSIL